MTYLGSKRIEIPLELFCKIEWVELDAEGYIHFVISKRSKKLVALIITTLKELEGKECYIRISKGKWSVEVDDK